MSEVDFDKLFPELQLPTEIKERMHKAGWRTTEEVVAYGEEHGDLSKMKGIGPKTADPIKESLKAFYAAGANFIDDDPNAATVDAPESTTADAEPSTADPEPDPVHPEDELPPHDEETAGDPDGPDQGDLDDGTPADPPPVPDTPPAPPAPKPPTPEPPADESADDEPADDGVKKCPRCGSIEHHPAPGFEPQKIRDLHGGEAMVQTHICISCMQRFPVTTPIEPAA